MVTGKTDDLKIIGSMTLPGGNYENVTVVGDLELNGNTSITNDFKVVGNCVVNGELKFNTGKVSGKADFFGETEGNYINIAGKLRQKGDLKIKDFNIEGDADVTGAVSSDIIDISGRLIVSGDCQAEDFRSKGAVRIGGMLNSGNINLKLYAESIIREIGGETIHIALGTSKKFWRAVLSLFTIDDWFQGRLEAEIIEGDNISLENTRAKIVRGNNVTIGAGCEIEEVEYKNEFHQSSDSTVRKNRKI